MASRGKRVYLVKALDADQAEAIAVEEATRSNWRVRQMRGVPIQVRPANGREWWNVTLWVTELPH